LACHAREHLLQLWQKKSFPVLSFDEEPEVLQGKLLQAGQMIGLDASTTDEPFFTDELRHAPAEGGSLPSDVESLHAKLDAALGGKPAPKKRKK